MGRHYRGSSFRRDVVISLKSSDVKRRSVRLTKEITKSTTRVLTAIQTTVIISSFCGFLWCLWKLPQEQNAFPDGFNKCPDLSYKVQNNKNVTIKCKTCPVCLPGNEPTPKCGSKIFLDTPTECTTCRPQTYSEEYGSAACKTCPRCGLRKTVSPCTAEKSTQCGDCPSRHYQEDSTVDSCKQCSLCCKGRWYAELECIYLKQCRRRDCVQKTIPTERSFLHSGGTLKIFPTFAKAANKQSMKQQNTTQISNFSNKANGVLDGTMPHGDQDTRYKRGSNTTFQKADTNPHVGVVANQKEATSTFQAKSTYPSTTSITVADHKTGIPEVWSSSDMQEQASLDNAHPDDANEPTEQPSYFGELKRLLHTLITLVAFVLVGIVVIASVSIYICWKKTQFRQMLESGCPFFCFSKYLGKGYKSLPVLHQSTSLSDIPVSQISLELKEKIARKLNVRRDGESSWGWQKLGSHFNIEKDVLRELENEYLRKAGSPTSELLEILGTRGHTFADLVNALTSSEVNFPDISVLIQNDMAARTH